MSRELDAEVATRVMGWKRTARRPADPENWTGYMQIWYLVGGHVENVTQIPPYSTERGGGALVEDEIERCGLINRYIAQLLGMVGDYYLEPLEWAQAAVLLRATPEQRCRAALAAVGGAA